jgi:transposase
LAKAQSEIANPEKSLTATIASPIPREGMRRNFYELANPGPPPIASEALKRIAEFYAIEKDIRGRSTEEWRLIRQQKSRPLAEAFERWLRAKLALISQKGRLADAIRYALSRWEGLTLSSSVTIQ